MVKMNKLKQAYLYAEEKWYSLVESKPSLLRLVDSIEAKSVPSFPLAVTVCLLAFLSILAVSISFLALPDTATLEIRAYADNAAVEGALVQVFAGGAQVGEARTNSQGFAEISVSDGEVEVRVSKKGLESKELAVDLSRESVVKFDLSKPKFDLEKVAQTGRSTAEDTYGVLKVGVVDASTRKPVNAFATVFDAETHATLFTLEVRDGKAVSEAIELDTYVYVVIESEEHLPFDNAGKPVKIRAGTNLVRASLEPLYTEEKVEELGKTLPPEEVPEVNAVKVRVTVTDGEKALKGAKVALYKLNGSESIRVSSKSSDRDGLAAITVPLANHSNKNYYLQASKTRYHDAYAEPSLKSENQEIGMELEEASEDTLCTITVNVTNELDEPQRGASVLLFEPVRFSFGVYNAPVREDKSNREGYVEFKEAKRTGYLVKASKGAQSGSEDLEAEKPEHFLKIVLEDNPAFLKVNAIDDLSGAQVNARYAAYYGGELSDSCTGFECVLEVKARKEFTLNVEADGYLPVSYNKTVGNLESKVESNETVYLYPEGALDGSVALFGGVYSGKTGGEVTSLMTGHSYSADFTLVTVGEAELSGLYFEVPDGIEITGRYPAAANEYAGGSCGKNGYDPENGYEWVDLGYFEPGQREISLEFTVKEGFELGADYAGNATLKYRSYAVVNGDWMRNPFDEELRAGAGEGLPSGCGAEAEEIFFEVTESGTRCSNNACITLWFEQGGDGGAEGFEAESMQGYSPEDPEYEELETRFEIELRKSLDEDSSFGFASDPQHYELSSAQYSGCEGEPVEVVVGVEGFGESLAGLLDCSDYHDYDPESYSENYVITGVVRGKPTRLTDESGVAMEFVANESTTRHDAAWYSVVESGGEQSDYASISFQNFRQDDNSGEEVPQPTPQPQNVYAAYSLDSCEDKDSGYEEPPEEGEDARCPYRYLTGQIRVEQERSRQRNEVRIVIPENLRPFTLHDYEAPFAPVTTGSTIDFSGPLEEGDEIIVELWFAPTNHGENQPVSGEVKVSHAAFDELGPHPSYSDYQVVVKPVAGDSEKDWYFDEDCGASLELEYDPARVYGEKLLLNGGGCSELGMRVSPLLPADGVPFNFTIAGEETDAPNILWSSESGALGCFTLCEKSGQGIRNCEGIGYREQLEEKEYVLRYDAEAEECPFEYAPVGNSVSEAGVSLELWLAGEQSIEFKVNVQAFDAEMPRVRFGPVITGFEFAEELGLNTQLWYLADNKQTLTESNPSAFKFKERAGEKTKTITLEFEEPGVQAFAFVPKEESQYELYEVVGGKNELLFESQGGDPQTNVLFEEGAASDSCSDEKKAYDRCGSWWPEISCADEYDAYLDCVEGKLVGAKRAIGVTDLRAKKDYVWMLEYYLGEELNSEIASIINGAKGSVYWRYNQANYYCQQSFEGVSCKEGGVSSGDGNWRLDDENCCRASVDDWRNMVRDFIDDPQPCTFCNNTYKWWSAAGACGDESDEFDFDCTEETIDSYECDERCINYGGQGELVVGRGEEYLEEGEWVKCDRDNKWFDEEDGACVKPCDNWCENEEECNPECGQDGLAHDEYYGPWYQDGWFNETSLALVQATPPEGDDETSEEEKRFSPLYYFPEYYEETPSFGYSLPVNSLNSRFYEDWDSFVYVGENAVDFEGCDYEYGAFKLEGVYDFRVAFDAEWTEDHYYGLPSGSGNALTLSEEQYVNTSCEKQETTLCGYLYDYERGVGAKTQTCVASLYDFGDAYYSQSDPSYETPPVWALVRDEPETEVLRTEYGATRFEARDGESDVIITRNGYPTALSNYASSHDLDVAVWVEPESGQPKAGELDVFGNRRYYSSKDEDALEQSPWLEGIDEIVCVFSGISRTTEWFCGVPGGDCDSHEDCEPGFACSSGTCVPGGAYCSHPYYWLDGECVECLSAWDCQLGEDCVFNECVEDDD